jgi:hypothetical protein
MLDIPFKKQKDGNCFHASTANFLLYLGYNSEELDDRLRRYQEEECAYLWDYFDIMKDLCDNRLTPFGIVDSEFYDYLIKTENMDAGLMRGELDDDFVRSNILGETHDVESGLYFVKDQLEMRFVLEEFNPSVLSYLRRRSSRFNQNVHSVLVLSTDKNQNPEHRFIVDMIGPMTVRRFRMNMFTQQRIWIQSVFSYVEVPAIRKIKSFEGVRV